MAVVTLVRLLGLVIVCCAKPRQHCLVVFAQRQCFRASLALARVRFLVDQLALLLARLPQKCLVA